ncbi:MAG: flavodoxin family protein [Symploca sp. SIO3E6]|nr:flavodoxin family protein [Caldora sp. SIO3E6]
MDPLKVLFINCTLKKSPEISNTEALWHTVAALYRQQGCQTNQLRVIDFPLLSSTTWDEGSGDEFPQLFEFIQTANILIVGTPVISGMRSSQCQKLIERLQGTYHIQIDPATGQFPLYNKVFGLLLLGDAAGGNHCLAQTCGSSVVGVLNY